MATTGVILRNLFTVLVMMWKARKRSFHTECVVHPLHHKRTLCSSGLLRHSTLDSKMFGCFEYSAVQVLPTEIIRSLASVFATRLLHWILNHNATTTQSTCLPLHTPHKFSQVVWRDTLHLEVMSSRLNMMARRTLGQNTPRAVEGNLKPEKTISSSTDE